MKEIVIKCDRCNRELRRDFFKHTCQMGEEELKELDFCPQCATVILKALSSYESKRNSVTDLLKDF